MIDLSSATSSPGAVKLVYDLAKDIVSFATTAGKKEVAKLSVDLETGFSRFLTRNLKQHSKVKTLLNPSKPIAVDSVFVSPSIEYGRTSLDEAAFMKVIQQNKFLVLTGMGGSGKSMFLKHLFVKYYNEPHGKIPFLIELRNIPKELGIKQYILKQLKSISKRFDEELLDYALSTGKFIFFFDGFDEVDIAARDRTSQEIIDLTYAFEDNFFVITSRPDDIFGSWTEFHIAKMKGFSSGQAIQLLKKLQYDRKARAALIDLIKNKGLYQSHSAYLANPLLCTIMLLTFDQSADVPDRMHLFFSQTFDVLFYRHDATKGTAFRRKFATSLSIDEFRSVIAAFSAFSYLDVGPTMKRAEASLAASKALRLITSQEKPADFLHDLCSSVSIMIKEGDLYSFIHRSFQEYFFAVFLSTSDYPQWKELVERILKTKPNDTVVTLLADINRDKFEHSFLLPAIRELCEDLQLINEETSINNIFKLFYYELSFNEDLGMSWTVSVNNIKSKHHHLLRYINEDLEIVRVFDFDWASHFNSKGFLPPEEGKRHKFLPGDPVFVGTPMSEFPKRLKQNAIALEVELSERLAGQRQLLSSAFFDL